MGEKWSTLVWRVVAKYEGTRRIWDPVKLHAVTKFQKKINRTR